MSVPASPAWPSPGTGSSAPPRPSPPAAPTGASMVPPPLEAAGTSAYGQSRAGHRPSYPPPNAAQQGYSYAPPAGASQGYRSGTRYTQSRPPQGKPMPLRCMSYSPPSSLCWIGVVQASQDQPKPVAGNPGWLVHPQGRTARRTTERLHQTAFAPARRAHPISQRQGTSTRRASQPCAPPTLPGRRLRPPRLLNGPPKRSRQGEFKGTPPVLPDMF